MDAINAADTAWILTATALVLLMTLPALALFYGGLVQAKNVLSVLVQCTAVACICSVLWFAFGYSLAFSGDGPWLGDSAAFLAVGGYHHHIGLNTWKSKGGPPPPPGTTGLFHVAIVYPTRAALADALRRLNKAGIQLDGASDHGVSEALYLRDPDGNGIELYWDRPPEQWPRTADGELAMYTRRLDLDSLLAESPEI